MNTKRIAAALLLALAATAARAQVELKDPTGDDKGPGKYVYPTDKVYKPGSFDLTGLKVTESGGKVTFEVMVNADLEDPWGMGTGFAIQMPVVFIDNAPGGQTEGLPGFNVDFDKGSEWDCAVVLSPQKPFRVKQEVKQKVDPKVAKAIVFGDAKGKGRSISVTVDRKALGGQGDPKTWGYQVLMQSNEGFPDKNDLMTRKVNEFEGQHRFGGGDDGDCDPHVLDVLAGKGAGTPDEVEAQSQMLAFSCGDSAKKAKLTMVKPQ